MNFFNIPAVKVILADDPGKWLQKHFIIGTT